MTTLAVQNHKIRLTEAKEVLVAKRQIRLAIVAGILAMIVIAMISPAQSQMCLDQGQPINCSMLNNAN